MGNKEANAKKQISLAGKLQFASLCIRLGHVFVSRLYDTIAKIPEGSITKITQEVRKDLYWWKVFLQKYNGVSMLWLEESRGAHAFTTDATLEGIGGLYGQEYFMEKPDELAYYTMQDSKNIAHMEMLAIMIAMKVWKTGLLKRKLL